MGRKLIVLAVALVLGGCSSQSPDQEGTVMTPPSQSEAQAERGVSPEETKSLDQRPR